MAKGISLLSIVFMLTLSVGISRAQQSSSPTRDEQGLSTKSQDVSGTISKVDATSLTIKQMDNKEQSYMLDSGAKVTLDGKTASISELKAGQKATVKVEANKATSVSATSGS